MQNKHMEQSVELASYIQKEFRVARRADRGVKQAGLLVLRKTSMPAVLVELGFITNRSEELYMKSAEGQNRLAKALYDAIIIYKRKLERKQGAITTPGKPAAAVSDAPMPAAQQGQLVYKVQILMSATKLPANSPRFKGYKNVAFYLDKGSYKYTYGETTDLNAIKSLQKRLLKDFEGAFIVTFKNGERIK
jgi:N-acetylmuramoyl-L-alanine amidase